MSRDKERKKVGRAEFMQMNLPKRLWRWDWDRVNSDTQRRLEHFCKQIPSQMGEGVTLLITGERGVGKSIASAIVATYARQHRYSCYYTTVQDWREDRREGAVYDEAQSVDGRMRTVDLLVIDDCERSVLMSSDKAYWYEQLRSLVSRRTQRGLVSVVVATSDEAVEGSMDNPVLRWPAGQMSRCVGFRVIGENQHWLGNKALSKTLLGD